MISEFLARELFSLGDQDFTVFNVVGFLFVLILVRLAVWVFTKVFLVRYYKRRKVNIGRQFAITQIFKYVLYVIGGLIALQTTGMKLGALYTASAALLIGIGIGLQQTFNDVMSGFILLMEGSIEKGDWLLVGDMEGKVERIGLRTSLITTRSRISVIVPNSKITVDNVINLSHNNTYIRYNIGVGVAYGSDVQKVEEILVQCATDQAEVLDNPPPFVRFLDFGDSALIFELHFWSDEFQRIEDVKSHLRFQIDSRFRESGVTIPFPQRDLHIKSPEAAMPELGVHDEDKNRKGIG